MARVVPSIVIAVIDRTFPWAKQADYNSNIRFAEASNLAGIVDLLDRLPNELLTLVARGDLEARKAAVARAAERVPFSPIQRSPKVGLSSTTSRLHASWEKFPRARLQRPDSRRISAT
jgi:hypothetical protein